MQSPVLCGQQVCVPPLCRDTDRSVWRECPMYVPAPASGAECGLADRAANFAKFHSTRRRALLGLSPCWKCLLALLQSRIYAKQALHTVVVAFFRNCKLRECLLQLYCGGCSVGGAAVEWSPCGQHLVVPHQHRGAEHTHFHIDICTCYCEFKFLICLIDFLNDQNPHPPGQCSVGHCRLLIGLKLFTKMSADSMNVWPVLHGGRAKDAGGVGGYLFFSISSQSALNPAPHLPALSPSLGRIKTVGVAGSGAVWPGWCWWYTAALHPRQYLLLRRCCTEELFSLEYKCRPLLPHFIMKTAIIVLLKHNKLMSKIESRTLRCC